MSQSRKKRRKRKARRTGGESTSPAAAPRAGKLPWWKKALFSLLVCLLFFVVLEVVLALCGFTPVLYDEDPYVGFTSYSPLFVEQAAPDETAEMVTAGNKSNWFGRQRFGREKPAGTYRIFCLGGSTTYGRPYDDATSFCGWLRELLPAADPSRSWEVINAGGISYGSYRVAVLAEELAGYDPDLFVIYTGHNEFLERRTYSQIINTPAPVRGLGALASRTRTYAAMRSLTGRGSGDAGGPAQRKNLLPGEVDALLDRSVGPSAYTRDDKFRRQVIAHYRYSLWRTLDVVDSAPAAAILVTPASNLRDCSPFKSEHRPGLSAADLRRVQQSLVRAEAARKTRLLPEALAILDEALKIDGRHALLHYRRARVLDELKRYDEAKAAYWRALDEDVCPLRALSPIREIVAEVAAQRDVPLVDFASLVESRSEPGSPGNELFLDHVHPTIDTNRQLALALIESMTEQGLVRPKPDWKDPAGRAKAVGRVREAVESRIDRRAHGIALRNVSEVMNWAGKYREAYVAARRAVKLAPGDAEAHFYLARCAQVLGKGSEAVEHYRRVLQLKTDTTPVPHYYASTHNNLGTLYEHQGNLRGAATEYERAISIDPGYAVAHYNLGVVYRKLGDLKRAGEQYRRALRIQPEFPRACFGLGVVFEKQGDFPQAAAHYEQAIRLRPGYARAHSNLGDVYRKQGDLQRSAAHYRQALDLARAQNLRQLVSHVESRLQE